MAKNADFGYGMEQVEMIPLPIIDLVEKTVVPLNWYVRLGEAHFILVFRAGTMPSRGMMERWMEKGVFALFVNADEYQQFASQNVTIATMLASSKSLALTQKMTLVRDAAESITRELNGIGMRQEIFQHVRAGSEAVVDFVEASLDLDVLITEMNRNNASGVNHPLAVAFVAVMIATEMRWNNPVILQKVAMGGFLHDIGESKLPPELVHKPDDQLNPVEKAKYESHALYSRDMLEGFKFIPEEIVDVVHQHHENGLGTGYPQRLKDDQLHPISRIVSLANLFCSLVIRDDRHPAPMSILEAIAHIEGELGQPYNVEVFAALKRLGNKAKGKAAA